MRTISTAGCFSNSSSKYFSSARRRVYRNPIRIMVAPFQKHSVGRAGQEAFTSPYRDQQLTYKHLLRFQHCGLDRPSPALVSRPGASVAINTQGYSTIDYK